MKYLRLVKVLGLFLLIASTHCLVNGQANKVNFDSFKALKFRNVGPAGMSGRITAIDVDLSNDNRIYVGAASGGVWLSESGGVSWTPIFDEQSTLAIGAIKINQNNPSEIWVGTGEGNPRNSLNTGNGIYKSLDGGKTWNHMGLKNSKTIHRIIIHKDNPNIVYAASLGSPWGPNEERGVFRTKDGGKTWDKILYVNNETGAADMVVDPTNPNKIIVAMWEHSRKPWTLKSGGKGSGLYITLDGGDTWKAISVEDGMPKGDLGRIGIAIAPSKPNLIYALIEAKENGLYKSIDGGKKWTLIQKNDIGGRPFYYSEIYVDPLNENRIYNLHTYVTRSEDGGRTFRSIMDYGSNVHPDHHAFWIHPTKPEYLINGNDGGLTISRDKAETWTFVNNLPVGQFYHVNVDNDFPYNVYGGMQDNGSWVGPSAVLKSGGIRNNDFQELYFGDGFDVVPNVKDSRYGYAMSQGGNVGYYDRRTGATKFVQPVIADTTELRYNWNAAIAQDPFKNEGVYFGSQMVHYSDNHGESWRQLSGDLTTNDKEKQKADESGGLTIDATGAENYCTILAIAPSPMNKDVIWVGTDDGNLQLTQDGGKSWTNLISQIKSAPKEGWIPYIEVSKTNAGEAFVIINNYRRNDYSAYAYHTKDFGKSWTRIADDTQIAGFTLCIVQHPKTPNLLFMGTDAGLYFSLDKGASWQLINKGFPQVQVMDLKIQEATNDLVIGTFGRSLWVLDDIGIFQAMAEDKNFQNKDFAVLKPQDAYSVSYRSVDGIRFIGQGEFVGDNDNIGRAEISVWKKPKVKQDSTKTLALPVMDKKDNKKGNNQLAPVAEAKKDTTSTAKPKGDGAKTDDKVKITVLGTKGDTLRRFSRKLDDGLNKISWGYETDGVDFPSKRKKDKDADPPSGADVLPGTYKMVFDYNGKKDSTMVTMKFDPRRSADVKEMARKIEIQKDYEKDIKIAARAFEAVMEARETVKLTDALLANQPDTVKAQFKTIHTGINKKLDSLEAIYFEDENAKGIQRDPDKLSSKIFEPLQYIRGRPGLPGANAEIALQKSKDEIKRVVKIVNNFITTDWASYTSKIATLKPIFKEVMPIK